MWNEEWRMNSLFEKKPWAMYMEAIKKTIANNFIASLHKNHFRS